MPDNEEIVGRINPNRPLAFLQGGTELDYFVPVVCTDRGQHKPVLLTNVRRHLDGTRGMSRALEWFAPPMADAAEHSMIGRESYVFRCPCCPRTPTIKAARWWDLLDALVRADGQRLDISLLP